jgi:hypothetical protein
MRFVRSNGHVKNANRGRTCVQHHERFRKIARPRNHFASAAITEGLSLIDAEENFNEG